MRKFYALLALLCLVAGPVWADTLVTPYGSTDGCRSWLLCDGQTATDAVACDTVGNASGDNLVLRAGQEYTWTAFADTSAAAATSFTIDLYTKSPGEGSGTRRALLNSSSITQANYAFSWTGLMGDIVAVPTCTTCTGGVNLIIKGCKLR